MTGKSIVSVLLVSISCAVVAGGQETKTGTAEPTRSHGPELAAARLDPEAIAELDAMLQEHVDRGDVVRLEKTFRVHRRRAQHLVVVKANGNVAVVGGRKTFVVDATTDVTNILFDTMSVLHKSIVLTAWCALDRC